MFESVPTRDQAAQVDPLQLFGAMQQQQQTAPPPQQGFGPSADELSRGVIDQLKQVLSTLSVSAQTIPALAPHMQTARQAVMQALMEASGASQGIGSSADAPRYL